MDFKKLLKDAGLSQSEFAREYKIPLRTVQNWCEGNPECKDWLADLIAHALKTGYSKL